MFWHYFCNTFIMMECSYIEVIVSLAEAAKVLNQGAKNGLWDLKEVANIFVLISKKAKYHNRKGVFHA